MCRGGDIVFRDKFENLLKRLEHLKRWNTIKTLHLIILCDWNQLILISDFPNGILLFHHLCATHYPVRLTCGHVGLDSRGRNNSDSRDPLLEHSKWNI